MLGVRVERAEGVGIYWRKRSRSICALKHTQNAGITEAWSRTRTQQLIAAVCVVVVGGSGVSASRNKARWRSSRHISMPAVVFVQKDPTLFSLNFLARADTIWCPPSFSRCGASVCVRVRVCGWVHVRVGARAGGSGSLQTSTLHLGHVGVDWAITAV